MEKKFTVIDTRSNTKVVFDSQATTLAELKLELEHHGISTADMSIQEGLTKTELVHDSSILPHDVEYRGTKTNNLVFRITNANKKIASGLTRKVIYGVIKEKNLEDTISAAFGKNFTNIATAILEDFINNYTQQQEQPAEAKDEKSEKHDEEEYNEITTCRGLDFLHQGFQHLLKVLVAKHLLNDNDIEYIMTVTDCDDEEEKEEGVYSDDEIDNMFHGM